MLIGPSSEEKIVDIINKEIGGFNTTNAIKTIKPLIRWFITYCNMQPGLAYPHRLAFFWAPGANNTINFANSLDDINRKLERECG